MPDLAHDYSLPPDTRDFREKYDATLISRVRGLIERGQLNAASLLLPSLERLSGDRRQPLIIAAEIALARKDPIEAERLVDAGLIDFPQDSDLLAVRGQIKFARRDLVAAAMAAADAVIAAPTNTAAKSLLGLVLLELGQTEEAAICLRDALGGQPGHLPTLRGLARAAPADAEAAIRALIFGGDASIEIHNMLILLLLEQNNIVAATEEIGRLVACGRADAQTGLLAIRAAVDTGNWGEATSLFNEATAHLPRHA